MTKIFTTTLCLLILSFATHARNSVPPKMQRPLAFIENNGQVADQHGKPRKDIDAKVQAQGITMFVGDGAIHYQWSRSMGSRQLAVGNKQLAIDDSQLAVDSATTEIYRMDVVLVGANKNAQLIKEEPQSFYENYYLPQCPDGVTAHSYSKLTYKNIYPKTDWVIYSHNNQLKYDFVVHPGGDAKQIKLRYEGATNLQLKDGVITATTPFGSITEEKPYSYIAGTNTTVASKYLLNGNVLSFEVAPHDGTLVIDPTLNWATYFGGENDDDIDDITADHDRNIVVAGVTSSITNIAIGAVQQTTLAAPADGMVAKFNENGQIAWCTYYGGNQNDQLGSVACDAAGNIYAAGNFSSTGMGTAGAHKENRGSIDDALILKLNANGMRVWATYYGGQHGAINAALKVDKNGQIYLFGYTRSTIGITTPGAYKTSIPPGDSYDSYVAKFDPTGQQSWGTYSGIQGLDYLRNGSIDANGNLYLAGHIYHGPSHTPVLDGFYMKFDASGIYQWAHIDASGVDITTISADDTGNVYLGGITSQSHSVATPGAHQTTLSGASDAVIIKCNTNGDKIWGTYFGGTATDGIWSIEAGANDIIMAAGETRSMNGIATSGAFKGSYSDSIDHFILQITNSGRLEWATYYGNQGQEVSYSGVSLLTGGALGFYGGTTSTADIATPLAYKSSLSGSSWKQDGYFGTMLLDTFSFFKTPFTDTLLCKGTSYEISYGVRLGFRTGNVFSIELSDINGSFAAPTVIGTTAAVTRGVIPVNIPAHIPDGKGYRMRIVSTLPDTISLDNAIDIRISTRPAVPEITSNAPLCENQALQLSVTNYDASLLYGWVSPKGLYIGHPNRTISDVDKTDEGWYRLYADNHQGCFSVDSIEVKIGTSPAITSLTSNSPVCHQETLQLRAESSTPGTSFHWFKDGFTSTNQNIDIPNADLQHGGTYRAVAFGTNGCPSDTAVLETIVARIEAKASSNSIVFPGDTLKLFGNGNLTGGKFMWTGPKGFYSEEQNPFIENVGVDARGNYTFKVTVGKCTDEATTQVHVSEHISFMLYPNPTEGTFTVKGNVLNEDIIQLSIINRIGQTVYVSEITPFGKRVNHAITVGDNLPNGVYLLRLDIGEKRTYNLKFVLKK